MIPAAGAALGNGPVYPVEFGTDGVLHIGSFHDGTDWFGDKVLWMAQPDFTGHAIVRGARIDSAGEMTFTVTVRSPSMRCALSRQTGVTFVR